MYREICNILSSRRISKQSRRRQACRTIAGSTSFVHRMITLTMVVLLKILASNTYHCNKQMHCRMALFAASFTTVPITGTGRGIGIGTGTGKGSTRHPFPASVRCTQSQQARPVLVTSKVLPHLLYDNSGRHDDTVVVLENVTEATTIAPVVIPSITKATPTTIASSPTPQTVTSKGTFDAASSSTGTVILTDDAEFVRPDRDLRSYRFIQLANNLRCLLVCDNMQSGVGIEAASVHVQAGHFDDTIPGLARK